MVNCENCFGDYLIDCNKCYSCFDCNNVENGRYCSQLYLGSKDCIDIYQYGNHIELCYECSAVGENSQNIAFCHDVAHQAHNVYYSFFCVHGCNNLFGCVGLKRKTYCIFNKQYTKEEYEALVPKIIEHMQKNGEWGEFFPPSLSPFGYNETIAQDYYPLTKHEAIKQGFNWSDYEPPKPDVKKIITSDQMKFLPDDIKYVPDDILDWALTCEVSGKLYKIIPQELKFYREHQIPIPRRSPDQRHKDRMALRNPRKLWKRNCMKCQKKIMTTYAPERPEIVYCEECYLNEVY